MRTVYLALATALLVGGCPQRTKPGPVGPSTPVARDLALLAIPPAAATGPALERLAARAEAGDLAAGWGRLHYLLDLFDDARFRRDDQSLEALASAMGAQPARGAEATDAALSFLGAEVTRVLRIDRLHRETQAAAALIDFDRQPPAARTDVFRRMGELRAVARGGPLASNAELRLLGYCRAAMTDAVRTRWSHRMRVLSHCLYPLYSADPEPYFADRAARRPPPPRWPDLVAQMNALAGRIADRGDRLSRAGAHQREMLSRFVEEQSDRLPSLPLPSEIGAPTVDRAEPYDWSPLLSLGDGNSLNSVGDDVSQLARPVQGDGRGGLALALASHAPTAALAHAIEVARGAGAIRLELLVTVEQRLVVPAGDYWAGRFEGDRVSRLAAIPVLLAAAVPPPEVLANLNPHVVHWRPERALLGLHLVVSAGRWELIAPTGTVAQIRTDGPGDPTTELRAALTRVRAAFPGESGLVLAPQPDVSHGAVIAAATAAARDAEGDPLFPLIAFGATFPKPTVQSLPRRIARRWRAQLSVTPPSLTRAAAEIRRCYQEQLERKPTLAGELRLELNAGEVAATAGPKALRSCAVAALGREMKANEIASATIGLRPK